MSNTQSLSAVETIPLVLREHTYIICNTCLCRMNYEGWGNYGCDTCYGSQTTATDPNRIWFDHLSFLQHLEKVSRSKRELMDAYLQYRGVPSEELSAESFMSVFRRHMKDHVEEQQIRWTQWLHQYIDRTDI
jgi:hypothetical protein